MVVKRTFFQTFSQELNVRSKAPLDSAVHLALGTGSHSIL